MGVINAMVTMVVTLSNNMRCFFFRAVNIPYQNFGKNQNTYIKKIEKLIKKYNKHDFKIIKKNLLRKIIHYNIFNMQHNTKIKEIATMSPNQWLVFKWNIPCIHKKVVAYPLVYFLFTRRYLHTQKYTSTAH
jgi:hypothetical protein